MTGKHVTCWTTQDRWEWIEHLCERPRSGSILCSLPSGRSSLEKVVPVWKLRPNPDDCRPFLLSPHVPGLCCHSYNHLEPLLLVPWMQLPEEESIWWLHARNGSYSGPPPLPHQLWGSWWYLSVNIILRNWVPLGPAGPWNMENSRVESKQVQQRKNTIVIQAVSRKSRWKTIWDNFLCVEWPN